MGSGCRRSEQIQFHQITIVIDDLNFNSCLFYIEKQHPIGRELHS